MKDGVIIVNTGRGGIINTNHLIKAIESQKIKGACLDVYEGEKRLFFADRRGEQLNDPVWEKLLTFDNVILSAHQAFLTEEALQEIATTSFNNLMEWLDTGICRNELTN